MDVIEPKTESFPACPCVAALLLATAAPPAPPAPTVTLVLPDKEILASAEPPPPELCPTTEER